VPQAVRDRRTVQRVLFGDTDVLEGESFEDHGIEDGARLSVSIKTRKPVLQSCRRGLQPNR